jgi:lactoylglutathione lyase
MQMNEQAKTRINSVYTVGVPVTDQDRALEFYTRTLGLIKRLDVPYGDGGRWIEVAPPDGETTIALVRSGPGVPAGVETGIRLTASHADEVHAALLASGVDADPEVLRWPGAPPMFAFRDQDANQLEIVERA